MIYKPQGISLIYFQREQLVIGTFVNTTYCLSLNIRVKNEGRNPNISHQVLGGWGGDNETNKTHFLTERF